MKIAIAQLNYFLGDFEGNLNKMLARIQEAKGQGCDLICFSELSVCGYPPQDFLEFSDFIEKCNASVERLAKESHDIGIIAGAPVSNPRIEGKDLHNAALLLVDGKIKHIQHKTLLPTYDIFDEYRYFEPADKWEVAEYKGYKIALTICEDIWNVGNENPLYIVCPMDEMMGQKPDIAINISASPFDYDHAASRLHTIKANVDRYKIPLIYINQVGAHTEVIFDGGSVVMNQEGIVVDELPYFKECLKIYTLDEIKTATAESVQPKEKTQLIHDALVLGIGDYFSKLGLKKAILGLSGGIDSALTCALAVKALGKENVRGLLMPSQYSSTHSVDDAIQLAKNLDIRYDIVPIRPGFDVIESMLKPLFEGKKEDVTEENIQARIRGILLMGISNKMGNILLNTTNKSEMAVGYGTMYGDMCGGLAVLGDVYKTEVYNLCGHINAEKEIIPHNTIQKPPSAELRPGQKDSDSLPQYDILDEVLYLYIEQRKGPGEIISLGFDEALVRRILKMVNSNEWKRFQAPPALRVTPKAFGMGRRIPIVGKYLI